ncbi:MAG TPA: hypothetical protein VK179_16355 [Bacteroidales bacterium]|nr:hypothetical protein [Bacteroidales bacterium]
MRYLQGLIISILIFGCQSKTTKLSLDSKDSQIKTTTDNFSDRLMITGDFNGDESIDTLKESFISSIDGKETNKYSDIEYDSLVALTIKKKPICRLISNSLTPLIVNKDKYQLFGLAFLKNEGDLDNDGSDELGLIVDWADWSNVNYYQILSYKNSNWTELFNFEIRDFDIADLKENKDSKGLLYRDENGDLIAKTWENGEQIDKKIDMKK